MKKNKKLSICFFVLSLCISLGALLTQPAYAATLTASAFTVVFRTNETVSSKELSSDKLMYINNTNDTLYMDAVMGFRRVGDNASQNFIVKIPSDQKLTFDPKGLELSVYETTTIPSTVSNLVPIRDTGKYMSNAELATHNIVTKLYYELDSNGIYEEYKVNEVADNANITSYKVELELTGDSHRYDDKNGVYLAVVGTCKVVIKEDKLSAEQRNSGADIYGFTSSFDGIPYQTIGNRIRYYNPVIEGHVVEKEVAEGETPTWDTSNPLEGIRVYLKDDADRTIASTLTDEAGHYKFSNRLEDGTPYNLSSSFTKLKVVVDDEGMNAKVWNIDHENTTSEGNYQEIGNAVSIVKQQYPVSDYPVTNWTSEVNSISNETVSLASNSHVGKFVFVENPKQFLHVTYDKNGGVGKEPTDTNAYFSEDTVTVLGQQEVSKDGYRFMGWNTQQDGNGETYQEKGTFVIAKNTILYAKWEKVYKVTYDANTGKGDVPMDGKEYITGEKAAILGKGDVSKEGYTFIGWNMQADGKGKFYTLNDTLTIYEDVILYAQWDKTNPTNPDTNGESDTSSKVVNKPVTGDTVTISLFIILSLISGVVIYTTYKKEDLK